MKSFHKTLALTFVSLSLLATNTSALVTIDSVGVGNAGNAADPTTGYGAVGYDYWIGKYEVTLNQYRDFLNAVAKTDTYSLWNTLMGSDAKIAGITRSGSAGSYTYAVSGNGSRPVTYVSWFDAARFANWLQNGQPTGAQGPTTTETGAYTLNGAISGVGFTRNANWVFGLPTENEWYKAAYHQPAAQGGDSDNYWLYPTASNVIPNSRNGSTTDANSANFYRDDGIANGFNGGFAVNNSTVPPIVNALTVAGAFSLADSFYGTFDQGGNVYEWNDAVIGSSRGLRGGALGNTDDALRSSSRPINGTPTTESYAVGFRLVIVPEPSVIAFMMLGFALLAWQQKRSL